MYTTHTQTQIIKKLPIILKLNQFKSTWEVPKINKNDMLKATYIYSYIIHTVLKYDDDDDDDERNTK